MERKLKALLESEGVKYEILQHAPTFTAMETAHATHVAGKELAKSVIVRIDGVLSMAVVPATHWADLEKIELLTGADLVSLAEEHEFEDLFPDCEPGAMPPFGELYGLDVYVHDALTNDKMIAFNAGSHTELVQMSYFDFERLVHPKVLTPA